MTIYELENRTKDIRKEIIQMLTQAGTGHPAGSLDVVEILSALYFHVLKHDPENPTWAERDRFVLSAGHLAPALYAILAEAGYFPKEELKTLRQLNSRLQGHPHNLSLPGIEASSGPLGQGVSVAVGLAMAAKMDQKSHRIYCLSSDGEHNEGQVWEAIMFAAKYKLHNLTMIVDRNNIQIDGLTDDIMPIQSLKAKYETFHWQAITVDGHSIGHLIDAFAQANASYDRPTVIIAHTIPGKGVDFMERDYHWHGKVPNKSEAALAIQKLESL